MDVPPPLPPPKYVSDALPDYDERRLSRHGSRGGRRVPVREQCGSGSSFPKNWGLCGAGMEGRRLPERLDCRHRDSSVASISSIRSPTDSDRRYEASLHQDEGYCSLSLSQQSVTALFSPFHHLECTPERLLAKAVLRT